MNKQPKKKPAAIKERVSVAHDGKARGHSAAVVPRQIDLFGNTAGAPSVIDPVDSKETAPVAGEPSALEAAAIALEIRLEGELKTRWVRLESAAADSINRAEPSEKHRLFNRLFMKDGNATSGIFHLYSPRIFELATAERGSLKGKDALEWTKNLLKTKVLPRLGQQLEDESWDGIITVGTRAVPNSKTARVGRPSLRPKSFDEQAGELWRAAINESSMHRVLVDQLTEIAKRLDELDYLPPSKYLEGEFAGALNNFNKKNSGRQITTWTQLVKRGNEPPLSITYGMRRLLSRCASPHRPSWK